MKLLRIAGLCLLALIGAVVLLYLIGVAVNWRDRPQSAAALEMKSLLHDRATVADTDNGFVYAMGFSVPASADPQTEGVKRVAWLEAANRDPKLLDADPVAGEVELTTASTPAMRKLREICADDPAACREAFVAARSEPRNELEQLIQARYLALVSRPRWREVVSLNLSVPIASFGDIVEGQRLMYVDLQDQMNFYSASYLDFAKRFEVPLGEYERVAADVEATRPSGFSLHVYNPVGEIFRSLNGMWNFASYPPRLGSIEGMRRAALLTASLRARGVQPAQIAEELKRSELRDPFDQKAFEWSDDEQAVVYEGPEAERSRRRHPYSY